MIVPRVVDDVVTEPLEVTSVAGGVDVKDDEKREDVDVDVFVEIVPFCAAADEEGDEDDECSALACCSRYSV